MNNNIRDADAPTEASIQRVLQAERDAERAIQDCEQEARQMINQARNQAQRINTRTDQRITNMEMRYGHKLDREIRAIERAGAVELRIDAGQHYDADRLQAAIERLATELCLGDAPAHD